MHSSEAPTRRELRDILDICSLDREGVRCRCPSGNVVSHSNSKQAHPAAGSSAGRQIRTTSSSQKSGPKVSKAKAKAGDYEKLMKVGSVLIHPGGLYARKPEKGSATKSEYTTLKLRTNQYPSVTEEEELAEHGLYLTEDPNQPGQPLRFNPTWSAESVNRWLRGLAPRLFDFMDLCYGAQNGPDRDQYHWVLARREHRKLVLVGKPTAATGNDLTRVRGVGRSISSYCICFARESALRGELDAYLQGGDTSSDESVETAADSDGVSDSRSGDSMRDSASPESDQQDACSGPEDVQVTVTAPPSKGKGKERPKERTSAALPDEIVVISSSDGEGGSSTVVPLLNKPWTRASARRAAAAAPRAPPTPSGLPVGLKSAMKRHRSPSPEVTPNLPIVQPCELGDDDTSRHRGPKRFKASPKLASSSNLFSDDETSEFDVAGYLLAGTAISSPPVSFTTTSAPGPSVSKTSTLEPPVLTAPIPETPPPVAVQEAPTPPTFGL
ncbi:hypothetical protein FKP32DRAFT_1607008 [Trametes sanguinea]|nr:hypothetical protein FKP32DRAFT_1607008 [Trametes sanguinea]